VTLTLLDPAAGFPNQSTADRINNIVSIRPDVGFADTMTGGAGSDFQLGGMGDDLLQGNEGDDIQIGDNIIMVRTWTPLGGPAIFERTTLDTNFAFVTGGDDTIIGDDGADIMIGGLGPDLFVGDTKNDLIFSDAYAGIFNATWPFGFGGETPKRNLITSNFAGPGPIDLVSEAQQNGSIGNRLDFTTKYTDIGSSDRDSLSVLGILSSGSDLLAQLSAFLSHSRITHSLALMLLAGADEDLLIAALRAELAANLASLGHTDLLAHEILIQTLLAKYLEKAGITKSATNEVDPVGESARMPYQIAAE
jgi:Ca2+-binding RTX toxin-like protein